MFSGPWGSLQRPKVWGDWDGRRWDGGQCSAHCLALGQHAQSAVVWVVFQPSPLLCLPQSLSPQDRAAYKEYISNVSLGAGWCWDKEGTWAGWGGVCCSLCCSLCPRPHPLLQKRKSMTKLRGPNPKSSRTTLQSKSVRSPSQKGDRERGVRSAWSGVAGTTDALPSLPGV